MKQLLLLTEAVFTLLGSAEGLGFRGATLQRLLGGPTPNDSESRLSRGLCKLECTYPLIAGGGNPKSAIDVGVVTIREDSPGDQTLEVCVETHPWVTKMYLLHIHAACAVDEIPQTKKGNPIPGQYEYEFHYPEGIVDKCVEIDNPDCAGDPVIAVHAEIKTLVGGMDIVDSDLPAEVSFQMEGQDNGIDAEASYWDTRILSGPLAGTVLNGYCVDTDRYIQDGVEYEGVAYSYRDQESLEGIIDHPENLDLVAWLINNFHEGSEYPAPDWTESDCGDGPSGAHTVSSGDIQLAIWYLIDDSTAGGLGVVNLHWACYMAEMARKEGKGFVPGCEDVFPLVLVPNGTHQRTMGQVTFGEVGVPCATYEESACAVEPYNPDDLPTKQEGFSNQFDGNNWFTYIVFDAC